VTSDQMFALGGTLLAAAIVAPLAKIFWDWLFQKRSKLSGILELHRFQPSTRLVEFLKPVGRDYDLHSEMLEWQRIRSFAEMTLTNTSKKKISGISVVVEMIGTGFFQVADGKTETLTRKKIEAGDLQPGHSVVIRFWSYWDWSADYLSSIKRTFIVSADELHGNQFKYPAPKYLARSFALFPRWIIYVSGALVWFALIIIVNGINIKLN
jgi:hypothetical protein